MFGSLYDSLGSFCSSSSNYFQQPLQHTSMSETPIDMMESYTLHSFEEKVAENVTVCKSTKLPISLAYHTFGNKEDPLIMLVMGLAGQCVLFETPVCEWIAKQGFYVCRFDNRDIGKSTLLQEAKQSVGLIRLLMPECMACCERVPYHLDDMADDAVALMKHLGKEKAHWYGASMGGMIVQLVGLNHPETVETLTLAVTMSGNFRIANPTLHTQMGFLKMPKSNSKEDIAAFRHFYCETYMLGSRPLTNLRALEITCEEAYKRGIERRGIPRQLAAISRQASRDDRLRTMTQFPTYIMHGIHDKLVPIANAYHLHNLIPNSELEVFPDLGHFVDPAHTIEYYGALVGFIKREMAKKEKNQS